VGHDTSCKWLASGLLGSVVSSCDVVVEVVGRIGYVAVVVANDMGCC
jgi:hypothetical protein